VRLEVPGQAKPLLVAPPLLANRHAVLDDGAVGNSELEGSRGAKAGGSDASAPGTGVSLVTVVPPVGDVPGVVAHAVRQGDAAAHVRDKGVEARVVDHHRLDHQAGQVVAAVVEVEGVAAPETAGGRARPHVEDLHVVQDVSTAGGRLAEVEVGALGWPAAVDGEVGRQVDHLGIVTVAVDDHAGVVVHEGPVEDQGGAGGARTDGEGLRRSVEAGRRRR